MIQQFASGALRLEDHGEHMTLTFDAPARKNAFSQAMWRSLPQALAAVEASQAKALVVTGAGEVFCAGADISEFGRVWASEESAGAYTAEIAAGMSALAALSRPTIAAIRGPCVGGGLGLALACDLRLSSTSARFGVTPGKLGLVYSLEDTKRLVDAVGPAAAKDILFTGRIFNADEALALRLVGAVVEPDALDAAVEAKVGEIAAASQRSARATKAMIGLILGGQVNDDDRTRAWFLEAAQGPDFIEGRAAFLERRKPAFPFR